MTEAISIVIAALGAIAAIGSFWAARAANSTAKRLSQIESDRRHEELIPQFDVYAQVLSNDQVQVAVKLTGPSALGGLDELTFAIRNDTIDHTTSSESGPTPNEIANQVWSPYRLVPGIDGAGADGRVTSPVSLLLGDDRQFLLEPTPAPQWMTQAAWKAMHQRTSLRITLQGRRGTSEPWSVPLEPEIHWPIQVFS